MAILSPSRVPQSLATIGGVAAAVVSLQQYHKTLYDALRPLLARDAAMQAITSLTQSISNPPTQAEVQAIQAKVNAIITALQTPLQTQG